MTNQQIADELLATHQANRRRNMRLEDWDVKVKPHLEGISAGAAIAARHARALPIKPAFKTHAQDDLAAAREVLEKALASIKAAETTYESKPGESDAVA